MTYIGIDPGKAGAMALLYSDRTETIPFDEKAYADRLGELLRTGQLVRCVVERVHSMPKQGVASSFNFGENYGFILGLLTAFAIPYETVLPNKWKREFGVTADKNTSITVARRLFPKASLRRTERCRTDDDGIAEAILMAEYCRRHS